MSGESPPVDEYRIVILPATRRDGEVTTALFQRAGFRVVCCPPGECAAYIEQGLGAIVLTDTALNDVAMNQVLVALSAQPSWSDIPTIVLSSSEGQSAIATRMLAGLANVTVLDRPSAVRTLLSAAQSAIRARQRQYQIRDQLRALRQAETIARESERRFRSMANTVPQLAWMADPTGSRFWFNERWFDYTGTDLAATRGWGWREVLAPQHAARVVEKLQSCFESGTPWEDTYQIRARDGAYRWFLSRARPILNPDGQIDRWVGTDTDMTEQLSVEETLREADRRKDEFLATLAHELRNPLAPIRQAARLSNAAHVTESQQRWCNDVIERQVRHMSLLLDDLLDISRVTRGTLALRIQPTDLAAIASVAIETAKPLIEAKGHKLEVETRNESTKFLADPLRVAQVLSNLLTNAAKYTQAQGLIRLSANYDSNGVAVSVADDGIGISAEALPTLFAMFSQVHSTLDRSEGGLGIGLALSKGLVELHGGSIQVHSDGLGRGSRFDFRLPAKAVAESEEGAQSDIGQRRGVAPRRVLIADDNRDSAESLGMLLRLDGHEVTLAHDGPSALSVFRQLHPNVVILDIGMPGQNGYEVARLIRDEPGSAPVRLIAVTGWGQETDKARALSAGFDNHLTKPIDPERLSRIM